MKRNNTSGRIELPEPESGRKIKNINLEIGKIDRVNSIKGFKGSSEARYGKHKKTLSNVDLLQLPATLKTKLVNSSTRNYKNVLEPRDSEKKIGHVNILAIPSVVTQLPLDPDQKLAKITEKFQLFKKSIQTVTKSTKKYKKNFKKVKKFVSTSRKKLFSKDLILKILFNAWKNEVKPSQTQPSKPKIRE